MIHKKGEAMGDTSLFLHDHRLDSEEVGTICEKIEALTGRAVTPQIFKRRKNTFETGSLLFVMAEDEDFREWLKHIRHADLRIVLLPFEGNRLCREAYAIADNLEEAIKAAVEESAHLLEHQVLCNGRVIIGCASAGESGWISGRGTGAMLGSVVRNLFSLRLSPLQITTAKEKEISTASLLVEAGGEAVMQSKRPYFFKASDNQCRRIASVIYAPQSVLGALKLRFFLAKKKFNPSETLPPGIGTIKSERITIRSGNSGPMELRVDGHKSEAQEIRFETLPMEAKIVTGWKGCASGEEKESLRIQNLPQESELISFFTRRTLPLVPIASEEAFAELFMKLRSSARISASYLLLLLVSVLMASTGLFQNSSPTIIGAMILAPLMAPIVAFAMGAIRFDDTLMQRSTKTILLSILIALGASALYAWWLPFTHITDQMAMRTHPTLLDLAVAVFAGIAAAYGYANSKVGESLAGVAIAVALVPPLCVSGIGIGWGSWPIFSNAFLLFLANIVGIVVASGAMFYLLGYASSRYASTAFFIKLLMVAVIAVPLYLSTRTLVAEEQIYRRFSTFHQIRVGETPIDIRLTGIAHDPEGVYARFSVITPRELNTSEKERIASTLQSKLGKGIGMVLTYRYRH
ncbi:TIGR00341 family protein [Hydrogenimonas sp.]